MPHIRELLDSSILVIVRYHNLKLPAVAGTEYETLQNLLAMPHAQMIDDLNSLIEKAVTVHQGDEIRRPLLVYVRHTIDQLRTFIDSQTPLDDEELKLLTSNFIQFILDIQLLLTVAQSTAVTITYNQTPVKLVGLIGKLWGTCKSGQILSETLFPRLLLPLDSNDEKVKQLITHMTNEHQHNLITKHAQETELVDLRKQVDVLRQKLHDAQRAQQAVDTGLQIKLAALQVKRQQQRQPITQQPRHSTTDQEGLRQAGSTDGETSSLKNILRSSASAVGLTFFGATSDETTVTPPSNTPYSYGAVQNW